MRLVLTLGEVPRGFIVPQLADEQITCGPQQIDRIFGECVISRATPAEDYDLGQLLASGATAAPIDAVACWVNGATRALPRGLAALGVPRVLLLGDVLAGSETGLARVLEYLRSETFDHVVLTQSRADAVWVRAAYTGPLHWLPGLMCGVREKLPELVRQQTRLPIVTAAPATFERWSMLNLAQSELVKARATPVTWARDLEERMELFGLAQCALVTSEHGELRDELFEALAAGAVVVTNRRADDPDFAALWPQGAPCFCYNDPRELVPALRVILTDPAKRAAMSRGAVEWYQANLAPARRRDWIADLIAGRPMPAHAVMPEPSSLANMDAWQAAAAQWPQLRRSHAAQRAPVAAIDRSAEPALAWLAGRLPRFTFENAAESGAMVAFPPSEDDAAIHLALEEAANRIGRGDYDGLQESLQALVEEPRYFPTAFILLAELAVELGQEQFWENLKLVAGRIDPADPRLVSLQARAKAKFCQQRARWLDAAWSDLQRGEAESALARLERLSARNDLAAAVLPLRTMALLRTGRHEEAVRCAREVVRFDPSSQIGWCDLAALEASGGDLAAARSALREAAQRVGPSGEIVRRASQAIDVPLAVCSREMDLLVTFPETCRRHGTGVLLRRFFPDSREFVTLRSETNYGGLEEFGGVNLLLKSPELVDAELRVRLARMLEPFRIRRVLCVPFSTVDFRHARVVHEMTGAPLCTYVMDDQNIYDSKVTDPSARAAFAASRLRLTISPEMQAAYAAKYPFRFDLMPPIVVDREGRRTNAWNPNVRPAQEVVLVGNVWSREQLLQVAGFVARTGLRVDWFGREGSAELERIGIVGRGFIPESELADRLTTYPYVLVPSGALDGTEKNEWLTRLSLPSRMVFLLQTQTPILVLGHPDTAAARFVTQLGVGHVVPYDWRNPRALTRKFTEPGERARLLENARVAAEAFVMPGAGEWIWRSLAAGMALPAPFDALYRPELALAGGGEV